MAEAVVCSVALMFIFLMFYSLQQVKNYFWTQRTQLSFNVLSETCLLSFNFFLSRGLGYFLYTGRVAMTSKGAKETIVSRLGFKSSSSASKAEAELERVRKENAHLRRKIDELAKRHIKPSDSERNKLLEVKEVYWRTCGLFLHRFLLCVTVLFPGFLFFKLAHVLSCVDHFRGSFPSRRCEKETISSCLLKSRSYRHWDSSWRPEEERLVLVTHHQKSPTLATVTTHEEACQAFSRR